MLVNTACPNPTQAVKWTRRQATLLAGVARYAVQLRGNILDDEPEDTIPRVLLRDLSQWLDGVRGVTFRWERWLAEQGKLTAHNNWLGRVADLQRGNADVAVVLFSQLPMGQDAELLGRFLERVIKAEEPQLATEDNRWADRYHLNPVHCAGCVNASSHGTGCRNPHAVFVVDFPINIESAITSYFERRNWRDDGIRVVRFKVPKVTFAPEEQFGTLTSCMTVVDMRRMPGPDVNDARTVQQDVLKSLRSWFMVERANIGLTESARRKLRDTVICLPSNPRIRDCFIVAGPAWSDITNTMMLDNPLITTEFQRNWFNGVPDGHITLNRTYGA